MFLRVIMFGAVFLSGNVVLAQQNVAVEQDKLMKAQGKALYGVILPMTRGRAPYNQATVDAALSQLEADTARIAAVFKANPNAVVPDDSYGSSQKIWQNKADFDSKVPPVTKAIADVKGKITNVETLKSAYTTIDARCNDCHETYRLKLK